MKKFKQILMPAAVILLGAGSAYATHAAKNDKAAIVQGYRFDPNASGAKCIKTPEACTTDFGAVCTWSEAGVNHSLYQLNGTMCGQQLYKLP